VWVATRHRIEPWLRAWGLWIAAAATILTTIAAIVVVAEGGAADPTESATAQRHAVVVIDSAVIVFREGLEAILIFAAVAAALTGARSRLRRPMAAGVAVAFAATVATWFVAQAILSAFSRYGDDVQAVTGLIAIGVLLVILNWFFHRIYWTAWIGKRNQQRKRLLDESEERRGLLGTAAVGIVTFKLQQRLPYRRMLVVTGVLLGLVLVVMVGGSARTLQDVGWLPTTPIGVGFPDWLARWFELVPTWETIGAQVLAAGVVLGSYVLAERMKHRPAGARGVVGDPAPALPDHAPAR
jgi:high-affinity iron transporter